VQPNTNPVILAVKANVNNPVTAMTSRISVRKENKIFLALLIVWFIVNLIQALYMEILSDEAYYGLFSEHLDWGYFDHPPMVALMIKASSLFFSGNLGIRFMTLLLQQFTLLLIWMTLDKNESGIRRVYTFFIVATSIFIFTGYGVITAPDAPLLFFTALFLYSYRRFIGSPGLTVTMLLAFSMAALVYSKYQAVLVIGFAVLSNLNLLKRWRFWLAGIIALILVFPHFYWQFSHDFPSLQYHLVYRLDNFKVKHVLEYLPNQLVLMNPFTLGAAFFVLLKFVPSGDFSRCLYLQIIGFFVFFLFIAFRDHVEPNWTVPCTIPVIILLTERIEKDQALFKYSRRIILPSILLVLGARFLLMYSNNVSRSIAYSGKEEKYKLIESVTKNLPVLFLGSYQAPSLYHYFTGKEGIVLSSLFSRQTQFDIWQFEKKYHNKPVFISSVSERGSIIYKSGSLQFCGYRTDSLQTVNRMKIDFNLKKNIYYPGDSLNMDFRITNPYAYSIDFNHHQFPVSVCVVLTGVNRKEMNILNVTLSEPVTILSPGQVVRRNLVTVIPQLQKGQYKIGISLKTALGPAINSNFNEIRITRKM
jgi:hypothetical protein